MTSRAGERPVREVFVETLRTARVARAGGEGPGRPSEVWYLLHGYQHSATRFIRHFLSVASTGRLLVAPEALSRFYVHRGERRPGRSPQVGASWMTREARELEITDYVRYLNRVALEVERREGPSTRGGLPPVEQASSVGSVASSTGRAIRRTLLGFSQGGHTAARWAVLGTVNVDRLVLWGSSFPEDMPAGAPERLRDTEVVLVQGSDDELRQMEREQIDLAWLREHGVEHRIVEYRGGHEIAVDVLGQLATG